jgi:hypothetical protein
MAERLLEAWEIARESNPSSPNITPEGLPSSGGLNESLIPDDPAERKLYAMRLIAQRCIYGVDKNPLAVEMAKLSLWLLTMAKDKPFEFLDHNIRCGDSLVGLYSIDQLKHFSLKPDPNDKVLFKGPLEDAIEEAITLRLKLEDLPCNSVEDVKRQEELLAEANEKIARLGCAADLLVSAEFWGENAKDKLQKVQYASLKSVELFENGDLEEFQALAAKECRGQSMFHWCLEFPEVIVKRGGFDAFVGNPPFIGGTVASIVLGTSYTGFVKRLNEPWHGKADLVGAFYRQAGRLLATHSYFGFLSTASLCRGETADSALRPLVEHKWTIYRAKSPFPWPGSASVTAICTWLGRTWLSGFILDDQDVAGIGIDLDEAFPGETVPFRLQQALTSLLGVKLSPSNLPLPTEAWERMPAKRDSYLLPAIGGDEMGSLPMPLQANRAFDVDAMTDSDIQACGKVLGRQLDRDLLRHSAPAKELRSLMQQNNLLIACNETTHRHLAFSVFTATSLLLKHTAIGIPVKHWCYFAVVQSVFHEAWAWKYGIRRKEDLRYLPKRCGDTFPLPVLSLSIQEQLAAIGLKYETLRRSILVRIQSGLTDTYNRFHDPNEDSPDIQKLRELHVEMDNAVAAAYDWTCLDLSHDFHETKQGVRYTISEPARRDILQRLLLLNHERHEEELRQGVVATKGIRASSRKKSSTAMKTMWLFDNEVQDK